MFLAGKLSVRAAVKLALAPTVSLPMVVPEVQAEVLAVARTCRDGPARVPRGPAQGCSRHAGTGTSTLT